MKAGVQKSLKKLDSVFRRNDERELLQKAKMISFISKFITLKPGDIIFTGTPEGVIAGHPKDKQVWLNPGDKISFGLSGLGELKFDLI